MCNVTALRHVAFEDLGYFSDLLSERGHDVDYIDVPSIGVRGIEADSPDLLVILGGPIGAFDDADYPFLAEECQLIKDRLERDLPTLGICLGAQLMARALGARVVPGEKEIGWSPLTLTKAGAASCLRHVAEPGLSVLHWHGDTFDLPSGAKLLASTDLCPHQAFSWGTSALALQFHPEVT